MSRWLVLLLAAVFCSSGSTVARADVVGRLRFSVKNAADEKPLAGAKITLEDSAGVQRTVQIVTNEAGVALGPPLPNRAWRVTIEADLFAPDTRTVALAADTTSDVEVLLEPLQEQVIRVTGTRRILRPRDTTSATRRSQSFLKRFPLAPSDGQNLSKVLRASPGFVEDSVNQSHPRGEHSATSIYINGFYLPGVLQGRAGPLLTPSVIETLDLQTGGYAPEYGGETAAVLNLTLRGGPLTPLANATLSGGGFGTFDGTLTFGGQAGAPLGPPDAAGRRGRPFGYLVNLSQRFTDNALEPPQPDRQTTHNQGRATTVFGNFDLRTGTRDQFTLTLNVAPARTEIANRTGLGEAYRDLGQGYGYAGLRNEDEGLASQDEAGQDVYQRDNNAFGVLQWRRQLRSDLASLFSIGFSRSKLEILNNNPEITLSALPPDNSVEFNPTIVRDYDQLQLQASATLDRGTHTIKVGGLYTDQSGDESYRLVPASQRALNALYALDPRLAPPGTPQTNAQGDPVLDALNNPVYLLEEANATVPTLAVARDGYYAAAYAQDTWRAGPRLTLNYGLRLDRYRQKQNLEQNTVDKTEVGPRVNLAYAIDSFTVVRGAYNRLFTQPPLAQGAILGLAIEPQQTNHYEASIERQFSANQTLKAAVYQKEIKNQLDTGLLLEGTQIGAYSTISLERATVQGFELSYDFAPRARGLGGYLTWSNSIAKPRGVNNLEEPIEDAYNDHDQRNTVGVGIAYTLASGASAGANVYHGSGVASSVLEENGARQDRTEVNLRFASGPRLFGSAGRGGLELSVENLFDQRKRINFQSPFSGTRFQQGRRILLSASGRF